MEANTRSTHDALRKCDKLEPLAPQDQSALNVQLLYTIHTRTVY